VGCRVEGLGCTAEVAEEAGEVAAAPEDAVEAGALDAAGARALAAVPPIEAARLVKGLVFTVECLGIYIYIY